MMIRVTESVKRKSSAECRCEASSSDMKAPAQPSRTRPPRRCGVRRADHRQPVEGIPYARLRGHQVSPAPAGGLRQMQPVRTVGDGGVRAGVPRHWQGGGGDSAVRPRGHSALKAPPRSPPCGVRPPEEEEKRLGRPGAGFSRAPRGRPKPTAPRGGQAKWQSHICLRNAISTSSTTVSFR